MARRLTTGWEFFTPDEAGPSGSPLAAGAGVTVDTTPANVHGGLGSLKLVSTAGSGSVGTGFDWDSPTPVGTTTFFRFYLKFLALPNVASMLATVEASDGSSPISIWLTASGKLQLWLGAFPVTAQVGADSAALSAGQFYRVEFALKVDTATTGYAELRLDGTSTASASNLNFGSTNTIRTIDIQLGDPVNSLVLTAWFDDVAVNDSSGAAQNTWPGSGKIVLLRPTADSAVGTGWTLGTGTAAGGNAFVAQDNAPPVGVADLTAGSDPKQIRNAANSANTNYDATMQTYTAAGIGASDTINVVQPVAITGAPSATSPKTGSVGVVSNPAIANLAFGGSAGTGFLAAAATPAGTYPTGWKYVFGTASIAPSVTKGTAPVMRVTQITNGTRISMVSGMGMYVDYTPASKSLVAPARRQQQRQLTRWY